MESGKVRFAANVHSNAPKMGSREASEMENALKQLDYVWKSLAIVGYFDSPAKRKLYAIAVYIVIFITLLGELIGFVNRSAIQARMEILFNLIVTVCLALYMNPGMTSQIHRLLRFLSDVSEIRDDVDGGLLRKALCLTANRAAIVVPKLSTIAICCSIPSICGWCVTPLLSDFDYRNKNFYSLPYYFQCSDTGDNLFPLKMLCSTKETYYDFVFFNSLTTFLAFLTISAYVWQFCFILYVYLFVEANLAAIEDELVHFEKGSKIELASSPQDHLAVEDNELALLDAKKNAALADKLITIIRYHQRIYGAFETLIPFLRVTCNGMLGTSALSTAIMIYLMLKEEKSPGYLLFQIKTTGVVVAILMFFFACSYCVQCISEMHTNIGNIVYSMPWYTQDTKYRKLMIQFQILLQQPIEVKSFGMYRMNLNLFARVLRISYSALNLMRTQLH